jgi:alkylresorcinol/alkylpyrone synthase
VNQSLPKILAVGTALPEHRIEQSNIREFARTLFASSFKDIDRLVGIFENSRIKTRALCTDLEWFKSPKSFAEKNALYIEHATSLSQTAARVALSRANLEPSQIDAIIFVSTTGIATPSLDVALIKRLGLSPHVARMPLWGLGCAGGASGLARASEYARGFPGKHVLLVAVELCSLTFQHDDRSKSNLVATSLFADGAAAVIVSTQSNSRNPELVGSYSTLIPDSEDVMGWDIVEGGLKVRFAKSVPDLVRGFMRQNLCEAAKANGVRLEQLQHFVTHPGGVKVLQAYQESLSLEPEALNDAREILETCGNMSSVSVLFVLEKFMERYASLPTDQYGAISAMGPGFSAEHVIFRT